MWISCFPFVFQQFIKPAHYLVSREISAFVFFGVESSDVRFQPCRVLKHPRLFRVNLALNVEMTSLTKSQQIKPFVIGLVAVKVVCCKNSSRHGWTPATNTFISGAFSGLLPLQFSVCVIIVSKSPHKILQIIRASTADSMRSHQSRCTRSSLVVISSPTFPQTPCAEFRACFRWQTGTEQKFRCRLSLSPFGSSSGPASVRL